jgi:hypothetical protein
MALPPAGTFHYVTTIPTETGPDSFPWPMQMFQGFEPIGESLHNDQLVGYSPLLEMSDAGSIPDPAERRTMMVLSRLTLRASTRANASCCAASFHIDRELTILWQPGDVLHLHHTCMWGTGLSLLRNDELVFAVGAMGLPFGKSIRVRYPEDTLDQIKRYHRDRSNIPGKHPLLIPVEIHHGNEMRSTLGGIVKLGEYEIWVHGGTDLSYPSGDTFIAVSAKGLCEFAPAVATAMLLLSPRSLARTEWPNQTSTTSPACHNQN